MSMSGILIRAAVLLCLFQLPLVGLSSVFLYFDEVLALAMGACFVIRTMRNSRISRADLVLLLSLVALVLLGLSFNLTSGISRPAVAIVQDAFTVIKVFVCYLGAKYLFRERDDCEALVKWTAKIVKAAVLVAFACLVLAHLGVLPFLSNSVRLGLRSYTFIYDSPGMLSQYCVLYAVVLLADLSLSNNRRKDWFFLILLLVVWASSLRTRAFVMIFVVLFLYIVVFNPMLQKNASGHALLKRIFSPIFLIPCTIAIVAFAGDQIELYFGNSSTARSYLLDGGIRIFLDYFPFGTGFGTYGTEAAGTYYSPLYTEYGLSSHWALGADGSELTDTFWPAILAEFGAIGFVLYLVPLAIVLSQIIRSCSNDRDLLVTAVFFVSYTLIASTATGVYFSYTVSDCMLFIGMAMGVARMRRNRLEQGR